MIQRVAAPFLAVILAGAAAQAGTRAADSASSIDDDDFLQLHGMLKTQPGESRWMEIDWHPNIWEARKKAAARRR